MAFPIRSFSIRKGVSFENRPYSAKPCHNSNLGIPNDRRIIILLGVLVTQQHLDSQGANHAITLGELPNSALQAIYHAVTGKTESMSRDLYENVVVRFHDIKNIVSQIVDQLKIHKNICDPTITIVTKYDNEKSVTHSSWERFEKLQENHSDVTSEITIKIETVIKIPNTVSDQRITINLNIDSAMPIIMEDRKKNHEKFDFGFFVFVRNPWRTVTYKLILLTSWWQKISLLLLMIGSRPFQSREMLGLGNNYCKYTDNRTIDAPNFLRRCQCIPSQFCIF